MSVIFSASLFFMSFVPLWISILFIDVKSIVTGGEIRTEVILYSIRCIFYYVSLTDIIMPGYIATIWTNL